MAFNPLKKQNESQGEYQERVDASWLCSMPLEGTFPSMIRAPFMSKREQVLFSYLKSNLPSHNVWPQVQLIRLLDIDESELKRQWLKETKGDGLEYPSKWPSFNKIRLLSVDYIVANANLIPVCAIELDGEEHEVELATISRDKYKEEALFAAKLQLFRFKNREIMDENNNINVAGLAGIVEGIKGKLSPPY
ncbi:DUF2726 domain-containing protein [Burkholderia glumae]